MSETSTQPTAHTSQGYSAFSILAATFLTMIAVFLLSRFSFWSSVALGAFAGFCMAAWNWFHLGRRRKALVHMLLGAGVYCLFPVSYILLALLLSQLFSPTHSVDTEFNVPSITSFGTPLLNTPQTDSTSSIVVWILLIVYSLSVGVLVLLYLYRATLRDVPKAEPLDDNFEIDLKQFMVLLVIAVISLAALISATIFSLQIRTAQIQNRVYCELLQPGMTFKEVNVALDQIGPHQQGWFQDTPYPSLSPQATSYTMVSWTGPARERNYDVDLWLGYDAHNRLVWMGRNWQRWKKTPPEKDYDVIECPWTFSQSITAR